MSKSQAIKKKCLDCSGGSPKEVTLCIIIDCPLWPYRLGFSTKDKRYKKRMQSAKRRFPQEFAEVIRAIRDRSENTADSSENTQIDIISAEIAA